MGLFFNEEEIVGFAMEQLKPELQRLIDSIERLMMALIVSIVMCTITYIFRETRKEKREREMHLRRTTGQVVIVSQED
ncbi:hypothetical protein HYDPIDRAFT_108595 [Hydnomerulius pinastri MD-312]|nr:hypothetical protein HYDPIDRAFT_108595 [Hydnomerulius pinastri MD-312]